MRNPPMQASPADGVPRAHVLGATLQVVKELGKGAFGVALLCRPRSLSPMRGAAGAAGLVVVKVVSLKKLSPELRAHALAEARLLSKLSHPNVVRCKDVWIEEAATSQYAGCLAMSMEYCNGGDIAKAIARHGAAGTRFSSAAVGRFAAQLMRALAYLHARKVIHRDVKPANIFLKDDGHNVALGDFGVSRTFEFSHEHIATYAGTPAYMPPEILQRKSYGTAVDTWCAGVVLYEMMVRRRPYLKSDALSPHDPLPALHAMRGTFDDVLIDITAQCLHVDPQGRPSAAAAADTLAGYIAPEAPPRGPQSPLKRRPPLPTDWPRDDGDHAAARRRAARVNTSRETLAMNAHALALEPPCGPQLLAAVGSTTMLALLEAAVALYAPHSEAAALSAAGRVLGEHEARDTVLELIRTQYFS